MAKERLSLDDESYMRVGHLHPSKIVTGAFGAAWLGGIKRRVVKQLYTHIARAYPIPSWTTMNYGYAPLSGETFPVGDDDAEQLGLNLYWRIATSGRLGTNFEDSNVVEIGSGRGGGAAFIARELHPARMTGLDIASAATSLATERHDGIANLHFATGDAENLTLGDASADVIINIESAHCYADVPRFLAEVSRVLRPGGELLFAGFAARPGGAYARLISALESAPGLRLTRLDDITANIVASLQQDEVRKRAFINAHVTGWFKSFAVGAYAMTGSAMRNALEAGETVYLAAVLSKPINSLV